MATFYFSCRKADQPIVDALVPLLQAKGHAVNYDKRLHIGAEWRQRLMESLLESDFGHIPDPIRGRSSLTLANAVECHQLLSDLALHTSLPKRAASGGAVADRVQRLVKAAEAPA